MCIRDRLTPAMAEAIGGSDAYKILLPVNRCNIHVVSVEDMPLGGHIDNAVKELKKHMERKNGLSH